MKYVVKTKILTIVLACVVVGVGIGSFEWGKSSTWAQPPNFVMCKPEDCLFSITKVCGDEPGRMYVGGGEMDEETGKILYREVWVECMK